MHAGTPQGSNLGLFWICLCTLSFENEKKQKHFEGTPCFRITQSQKKVIMNGSPIANTKKNGLHVNYNRSEDVLSIIKNFGKIT